MEKINAKTARVKRYLRTTLLEMLTQVTLDRVSVAELCRQAGVNRTTFYHHYKVVNDIVDEIFSETDRDCLSCLPSEPTADGNFDFDTFSTNLCRTIYAKKDLYKALYNQNNYINQYFNRHSEDLERFNDTSDRSQVYLARFVAGGVDWVLAEWIRRNYVESPDVVASYLSEFMKRFSDLPFNAEMIVRKTEDNVK